MRVMRCTAPLGWRMTIHAECQTGLRRTFAWFHFFDSGSHFQAKNTLQMHRDAASRPGMVCPHLVAKDPMTGPSIVPRFVAAEIQPRDRARSFAGTVSAI